MANYLETVEDTCEKLHKALHKANEKLDKSGDINERDAEYLRNLISAIKSAKTIKAMDEASEYSNAYNPRTGTYATNDGRSYGDESYARRRDSMGRYTSEDGYSRAEAMEDMAKDIRKTMPHMPEELKQEARHFLSKLEQRM